MSRFLPFDHIKSLENLPLLASQVVEGFIIGLHKSPFHGFSVEFAEHRLYNPGESTKNIDWKVFARTEKLFTKKYEEETNLRCNIVIDCSGSMAHPIERLKKEGLFNKLEYSILSGAAIMNILKRQRDAFSLTLFDQKINLNTECKSSTSHYNLLINHLQQINQENLIGKQTSLSSALHEVAATTHKRSLIVIFSDFLLAEEHISESFESLQHLIFNKHEVIIFHMHDSNTEHLLDYPNKSYRFVDIETNETIMLRPNEIRDSYQAKMKEQLLVLELKCRQYGIDFVPIDIQKDFKIVLQNYFIKRSKINR